MGVSIPIAALAIGAAGTTYSIANSISAKNSAEQAASNQSNADAALSQKAQQQAADQSSQQAMTNTEQAALTRQKQLAAGSQGMNSTILTSPMGIQSGSGNSGQAQGGQKTLLGM